MINSINNKKYRIYINAIAVMAVVIFVFENTGYSFSDISQNNAALRKPLSLSKESSESLTSEFSAVMFAKTISDSIKKDSAKAAVGVLNSMKISQDISWCIDEGGMVWVGYQDEANGRRYLLIDKEGKITSKDKSEFESVKIVSRSTDGKQRKDNSFRFDVDGYNPDLALYHEAKFGLGNGRIMTRSSGEENKYGERSCPMTFMAGVFNKPTDNESELVNIANWLPLRFRTKIGGEYGAWFNVEAGELLEYRLRLDMAEGVFERIIRWKDDKGRVVQIKARRIVSQARSDIGAIEYTVNPEFDGALEFEVGLDADVYNHSEAQIRKNIETVGKGVRANGAEIYLSAKTNESDIYITEASHTRVYLNGQSLDIKPEIEEFREQILQRFEIKAAPGQEVRVEKIVSIKTSRDEDLMTQEAVESAALVNAEEAPEFSGLYAEHAAAWAKLWESSGLEIEGGDDELQRTVNSSTFSLLQVARAKEELANIGARVFGEHYKGRAFWDTEIYMLPFYTYTQPATARALLMYRYHSLSGARQRAQTEGYKGARYPWESGMVKKIVDKDGMTHYVGGQELTTSFIRDFDKGLIPGENLLGEYELHVNWAIVAAIQRYYEATGDAEFLDSYGIEMMLEIARFAADPNYAVWNAQRGSYDTRSIGPNEWADREITDNKPGVLNNAYNNVMTAYVIHAAIKHLGMLRREQLEDLLVRAGMSEKEYKAFIERGRDIIRKIYIPYDAQTGLILESETYADRMPMEGFVDIEAPWHGNKIREEVLMHLEGAHPRGYQIARQPDAMMIFMLREIFPEDFMTEINQRFGCDIFDDTHLEMNRQFYSPRTSGESTLVFTAMATYELMAHHRIKSQNAFMSAINVLRESNRQRVGRQGIGTANNGGIYYAMVRGWAGLELGQGRLKIAPILPSGIERLKFKVCHKGLLMEFEITPNEIVMTPKVPGGGNIGRPQSLEVRLYEREVKVQVGEINRFSIPEQTRFSEPDAGVVDKQFESLLNGLKVLSDGDEEGKVFLEVLKAGLAIVQAHRSYLETRPWYVYDILEVILKTEIQKWLMGGYELNRELMRSVTECCEILHKDQCDAGALNTIADIFRRESMHEKSLMVTRLILSIDDNNTDALHTMARVYREQGRMAQAEAVYQRILGIDYNNWKAYAGSLHARYSSFDFMSLDGDSVVNQGFRLYEELTGKKPNCEALGIHFMRAPPETYYPAFWVQEDGSKITVYVRDNAAPQHVLHALLAIIDHTNPDINSYLDNAANQLAQRQAVYLVEKDKNPQIIDYTATRVPEGYSESLLERAEGLTSAELRGIYEKECPVAAIVRPHTGDVPEKDRSTLVVINDRIYPSFQAIAKEIKVLMKLGVYNFLLLGSYQESYMSRNVSRAAYDLRLDSEGVVSNLYVDRDKEQRIISIVRDTRAGMPDYSAAAFAVPEYKLNPDLGGREGFERLILDTPGANIYLDYVPHSTSVDSPLLQDESLQTGPGYWYVYKNLSENDQMTLLEAQKAGKDQKFFLAAAEKILAENPSYFLHYSAKLRKWILLVLSRDASMKPSGQWFYDLQVLLDLSNPEVRNWLKEQAVGLVRMGAKGVRVDCAQSVIVGIQNQPLGFLNTWKDHVITNPDPDGQEELYGKVIPAVREIEPKFYFFGEAFWFFDELEYHGFNSLYQLWVYNLLVRKKDIPELRRYLVRTPVDEQLRRTHGVISHDDIQNFGLERNAFPDVVARRFINQGVVIATLPGNVMFHDEQLSKGSLIAATGRNLVLDDGEHPDVRAAFERLIALNQDPIFRKGGLHVFNNNNPQVLAFARFTKDRTAIVVSNQSGIISRRAVLDAAGKHGISWDALKGFFEEAQPEEERLALKRDFDDIFRNSPLSQVFLEELRGVVVKALLAESAADVISLREAAQQLNIKDDQDAYYILIDRLNGEAYIRNGHDLFTKGLSVELAPHTSHIFMLQGIRDKNGILSEMAQRNHGDGLSLSDIYLLIVEFGIKVDFDCEGKVGKAEAIKLIQDDAGSSEKTIAFFQGHQDFSASGYDATEMRAGEILSSAKISNSSM